MALIDSVWIWRQTFLYIAVSWTFQKKSCLDWYLCLALSLEQNLKKFTCKFDCSYLSSTFLNFVIHDSIPLLNFSIMHDYIQCSLLFICYYIHEMVVCNASNFFSLGIETSYLFCFNVVLLWWQNNLECYCYKSAEKKRELNAMA